MCNTDGIEGEIINIGSSNEISIGDLGQKIKELMQSDIAITSTAERIRPEKSEVNRLSANINKASKLIDWKPSYSLTEGLKLTIDWFSNEENLRNYKTLYNI